MVELIDAWLRAIGPWGYLILAVAALAEYVFPPFPGDTVGVLGGAWAQAAGAPVALVVVALTLGSVVGIAVTWRAGLALGARVATWPAERRVLGVSAGQLHRAQELMRRRGTWLLLANRFIPSFRSITFVAAGAAGVSLPRALVLGTASTLAWNGLLVGLGVALGHNRERIEAFFLTYQRWAFIALGVLALGVVLRWVWRRRRGG